MKLEDLPYADVLGHPDLVKKEKHNKIADFMMAHRLEGGAGFVSLKPDEAMTLIRKGYGIRFVPDEVDGADDHYEVTWPKHS